MLYRVAGTATKSTTWERKSTPLSSQQAVLDFLQLYHIIPTHRLRTPDQVERDRLGPQSTAASLGPKTWSVPMTRWEVSGALPQRVKEQI